MKLLTTSLFATTILIGGASSTAYATPGVYFGVGLGNGDLNETAIDDEISKKIFAGYQVNKYFAVEAAYQDFGNYNSSAIGASSELDGLEASVLASYPINSRVSVYGRVGIWNWDYDTQVSNTSFSEGGTDKFYGAGLDVKLNQRVKVRAAWDEYELDDDSISNVTSLNLLYTF